ncbi:hypothetical protein E4T56_gene5620, partial [Termitomyces sp. T112]
DIAVDSMASDSTPTAPTLGDFTGGSSPSTTVCPANLNLHEIGAISVSWGD